MMPRKIVGAFAFVVLLVAAYIFDVGAFGVTAKLAYALAVAAAFFATFYDRKNFPEKTWDFNPKRGLLFFGLGLLVFPIMAAARSFGEVEIQWDNVVLFTLIAATLAGIAGTLTENIGI
ncbi:MAG: hypothetical protein AAF692_07645 [Pseudomonadota bacterium]